MSPSACFAAPRVIQASELEGSSAAARSASDAARSLRPADRALSACLVSSATLCPGSAFEVGRLVSGRGGASRCGAEPLGGRGWSPALALLAEAETEDLFALRYAERRLLSLELDDDVLGLQQSHSRHQVGAGFQLGAVALGIFHGQSEIIDSPHERSGRGPPGNDRFPDPLSLFGLNEVHLAAGGRSEGRGRLLIAKVSGLPLVGRGRDAEGQRAAVVVLGSEAEGG